MSDTNEKSKGGFHFGNVGGGVNVTAGGDVVADPRHRKRDHRRRGAAAGHDAYIVRADVRRAADVTAMVGGSRIGYISSPLVVDGSAISFGPR